MKKTLARKKEQAKQEKLRSEYRFDYRKSKPNRFAAKMSEDAIAIVPEPDIAAVKRRGSPERVHADDTARVTYVSLPAGEALNCW
jgi:hypothetical protein